MNASLLRSGLSYSIKLLSLVVGLGSTLPIDAADSAAPDSKALIPVIISMDELVQKELVNLDQLLLANPKLEETLRTNLDQLTEKTFREQNPEVDSLLKRRPELAKALKTERHFLIHRYVARMAGLRVTRPDAVALDKFLTAHPDIEKALAKRPSQIVEPDFLIAHPQLANFFETHPALSSVLLQRSDKKKSGSKTGPAEKKN